MNAKQSARAATGGAATGGGKFAGAASRVGAGGHSGTAGRVGLAEIGALAVLAAVFVATLVAGGFAGCDARTTPEKTGVNAAGGTGGAGDGTAPAATRFPLAVGGKKISARLAVTDLEVANGLMGCTGLGTDEGMLFVFTHDGERAFWMRNVPINLDLGYFTADGVLVETHALIANNPDTVVSRSPNIRYVLEMPENWFTKNGLKGTAGGAAGGAATLDLAAVRAALRARDFPPARYVPPAK
ncbi:MAG: DUF192 domain-containing protein [Puniceicoccales bacterium]|jgi:uncharacterized membrane protein (UPF0127 family)|nr:DUF192 domain-containing protein [Puniceicoccales bacterium]